MKVSLIIPTYNREEDLVLSIQCALKQDYKDLEILVIDQTKNHKPETTKFLEENLSRAKWIRPSFASITKARNEGIRQSSGEIIVMIDDDTEFAPDFISEHVKAHEKYDIVQGRVQEEGSPVHKHPTWVTSRLKFTGGNNCLQDGIANTITGCNFSFKRSLYEKIGPFDERFQGTAIHEDGDFGHRAHKAGFKVFFATNAKLFHHRAMTGGVETGAAQDYFFKSSYYENEFLFCKKHFSKLALWNYRIRLTLRGLKQLKKLIKGAEKKAEEKLRSI